MHHLRRAAVRTACLQPTRKLSTHRTPSARANLFQLAKANPSYIRPFHQARIWRADEDRRPIVIDEASPADATTTGETVPVEALEEAAAAEPFERGDVAAEFKEEAVAASEAAETAAEIAVEEAAMKGEAIDAAEAAATAAEIAGSAAEVAELASVDANSQPAAGDSFAMRAGAPAEEVAATAAQTAQVAAEAATMGAAAAAVAPEFRENRRQPSRQSNNDSIRSSNPPNRILYVGNLFFEVTAQQLEAEFAKFGQVINSRVVTDQRGLSKGFAYVEFADQQSADRAVRELDQRVFQGRRMAVQYHVRRDNRRMGEFGAPGMGREPRQMNPPSKTLFIGNMSYQMSDRDLNDLFREIRDVLDVRVAIDRRTGQPRGFAHADFVDVPAAQRAKEVLENKVVYGRQLKIDFSLPSSSTRPEQL